jgi:hypothetical protein
MEYLEKCFDLNLDQNTLYEKFWEALINDVTSATLYLEEIKKLEAIKQ